MKRHTVADVMTRNVVAVSETTGYKEIVEVLARNAVSAAPVVDENLRVVGVVSEADLLYKVELAGAEPHSWLLERKHVRTARDKANADFARELMTSPAVTISTDESIVIAAKLMDSERVKRLPVLDADGRLAGIVSRADLLRPFLRSDDDIRDEIREGVVLRTMWMDPNSLTITVDQGVVTMRGEVERRSSVPILVDIVRAIPGVVDVIERLSSRFDDRADLYAPTPTIVA